MSTENKLTVETSAKIAVFAKDALRDMNLIEDGKTAEIRETAKRLTIERLECISELAEELIIKYNI